jgi:hypothetical protein
MPPPDHCHIVADRGRLLADLWQDCASNATFCDGGRPGRWQVLSCSGAPRWRPRRPPPRPGLRRNCFSYLALRYASREAGYTPRSPLGRHPPASPCRAFWHKPLLIKMLCRCQPCQPFGRFRRVSDRLRTEMARLSTEMPARWPASAAGTSPPAPSHSRGVSTATHAGHGFTVPFMEKCRRCPWKRGCAR